MLVVALDKPTVAEAAELVSQLGESVEVYKVGLELVFSPRGLAFAEELRKDGKKIFLDMKLLDIPNTVEKAVANIARLGFDFLTVHGIDRQTLDAAVRGRAKDTRPARDRLALGALPGEFAREALGGWGAGKEEGVGVLTVRLIRSAQTM